MDKYPLRDLKIEWWNFFPEDNRMGEQPKPKGTGAHIFPMVIADLQGRMQKGMDTYGESLRAHNGRDVLLDIYEELLDAAVYVKQSMVEREDKFFPRVDFSGYVHADTVSPPDLPVPEKTMREFLGSQEAIIEAQMKDGGLFKSGLPPVVAFNLVEPSESIAQEAHRLVLGDRGEAYGHPIFDMSRTADMLTALLRDKLQPGVRLEAEDIGQAMICVKQSRHRNSAKRDNLTDTAGYALTLQMIAEWRAAHPGEDPRDHFAK